MANDYTTFDNIDHDDDIDAYSINSKMCGANENFSDPNMNDNDKADSTLLV